MDTPAQILRYLRTRAKLSQGELGRAANISTSRISDFETGRRKLLETTGATLLSLCTPLRCTIGQLLGVETILEKTRKKS